MSQSIMVHTSVKRKLLTKLGYMSHVKKVYNMHDCIVLLIVISIKMSRHLQGCLSVSNNTTSFTFIGVSSPQPSCHMQPIASCGVQQYMLVMIHNNR